MNNQDTNNESIIIEDLATQNAEDIKGGPTHQSKRDLILRSTVADGQENDGTLREFKLNHNETVSEDHDEQAEAAVALTDLSLDETSEAEISGGLTSVQYPYKVALVDSPKLNHNETVSEDSEAETQKLTDLTIDNETESAITGGMWLPAVQKVREAAAGITSANTSGGGRSHILYQDITIPAN